MAAVSSVSPSPMHFSFEHRKLVAIPPPYLSPHNLSHCERLDSFRGRHEKALDLDARCPPASTNKPRLNWDLAQRTLLSAPRSLLYPNTNYPSARAHTVHAELLGERKREHAEERINRPCPAKGAIATAYLVMNFDLKAERAQKIQSTGKSNDIREGNVTCLKPTPCSRDDETV